MKVDIKQNSRIIFTIASVFAVLVLFVIAFWFVSNVTKKADLARPLSCGALHVQDGKLVDEKNRQVQLKGVSTNILPYVTSINNAELIDGLSHDWNANLLRVVIPVQQSSNLDKEDFKQYFDLIDLAIDNDMYVVIDWHSTQSDNPNNQTNAASAFFNTMSLYYKDKCNLLYEIWDDSSPNTSWIDVMYYANTVIENIKNDNPDAPIIVGTGLNCQELNSVVDNPIADYSNILYSFHFAAGNDGTYWQTKIQESVEKHKIPVFITEFSITDKSKDGALYCEQADEWINFLNKLNISYAMWSFSDAPLSSSTFNGHPLNKQSMNSSALTETGFWIKEKLNF